MCSAQEFILDLQENFQRFRTISPNFRFIKKNRVLWSPSNKTAGVERRLNVKIRKSYPKEITSYT